MIQYQPGDVIGLPAEPPVGTVLEAQMQGDKFRIKRTASGWGVVGAHRGGIDWGTAFQAWGPASNGGHPFTVVQIPTGATTTTPRLSILDVAREWLYYRDLAHRQIEIGFSNLAEETFVGSEIAKDEVLRRLAELR